MHVDEESDLEGCYCAGIGCGGGGKERPFLLDVRLPLGLPEGGRAATPFSINGDSKQGECGVGGNGVKLQV